MEWGDIRFIIYVSLGFLILVFGLIDYNTPEYWVRARWAIIQAAVSIWLTVEILDKLSRKREFESHGSRACKEAIHNICQFSAMAYIFLVNSGIRDQSDNSLIKTISNGSSLETSVGRQLHTVEHLVFKKIERILCEEGNLEPTEDQLKDIRYFCASSINTLDRLEYYINCIMPFFPERSDLFESYLNYIKDTKSWASAEIKGGREAWGIMSNVNLLLDYNSIFYSILLKKVGIRPPRQYVSLETRRKMPSP
jgi:hypothetical protein